MSSHRLSTHNPSQHHTEAGERRGSASQACQQEIRDPVKLYVPTTDGTSHPIARDLMTAWSLDTLSGLGRCRNRELSRAFHSLLIQPS